MKAQIHIKNATQVARVMILLILTSLSALAILIPSLGGPKEVNFLITVILYALLAGVTIPRVFRGYSADKIDSLRILPAFAGVALATISLIIIAA